MYHLRGREQVDAWFAGHDIDQVRAMATWIKALMAGPLECASGAFQQPSTGRTLHFAYVPNTNAMVSYVVMDAPVRVVTIISIIEAPAI